MKEVCTVRTYALVQYGSFPPFVVVTSHCLHSNVVVWSTKKGRGKRGWKLVAWLVWSPPHLCAQRICKEDGWVRTSCIPLLQYVCRALLL